MNTSANVRPMDGIEPVRRTAILNRAAVLKRYCAIPHPTEAETASHAAMIGVSVNRFLTIVKAWRALPRAEAIDGAKVKPDRTPKLHDAAMAVLQEAIQTLGPSGSITELEAFVRTRCEAKGIEPPSMAAVHYRVMKARSETNLGVDGAGFVVFQCRAQIPVSTQGKIVFPWLTGAIALPTKSIIHPSVSIGEPEILEPLVCKLLDERGRTRGGAPIYVPATKRRKLSPKIRKEVISAGTHLTASMLLGSRLGNMTIFHRPYPGMHSKLARRLGGQMNSALHAEDAKAAIIQAVETHNAAHAVRSA